MLVLDNVLVISEADKKSGQWLVFVEDLKKHCSKHSILCNITAIQTPLLYFKKNAGKIRVILAILVSYARLC